MLWDMNGIRPHLKMSLLPSVNSSILNALRCAARGPAARGGKIFSVPFPPLKRRAITSRPLAGTEQLNKYSDSQEM
jgi:hypothetical protein